MRRDILAPPARLAHHRLHILERQLTEGFQRLAIDMPQRPVAYSLIQSAPPFTWRRTSAIIASRVSARAAGSGMPQLGVHAREVHVARGDRDRERGNEQTRSRDDPASDGLPQIDIREAGALRVDVAQAS